MRDSGDDRVVGSGSITEGLKMFKVTSRGKLVLGLSEVLYRRIFPGGGRASIDIPAKVSFISEASCSEVKLEEDGVRRSEVTGICPVAAMSSRKPVTSRNGGFAADISSDSTYVLTMTSTHQQKVRISAPVCQRNVMRSRFFSEIALFSL